MTRLQGFDNPLLPMSKKYQPGIFITFEGTEGSGKSTLIKHLARALEARGNHVIQTREPGGTSVSEKIREILLHHPMNPWTELLLYEAARAEHLTHTILPGLEQGAIVLCDRFTDSSLAYQGYARKLPWEKIQALNRIATLGVAPSLTIFLDIDPEKGLRRAQDANRFEAEGVYFQKQVRLGYLKARRENPKKWFSILVEDKTPEQLTEIVVKECVRRFKNKL